MQQYYRYWRKDSQSTLMVLERKQNYCITVEIDVIIAKQTNGLLYEIEQKLIRDV